MGFAFRNCACPFPYARVYAWGGNFADSANGLFPGDKASFVSCYESAIALVNSIDISSVGYGNVRWFNYGGITSPKSDATYIDSGNVANNPTNLPGDSTGAAPCGTGDYGAIVPGASELEYMGLDNPIFGVNPGGYAIATYSGGHGVFAVSRILVDLRQQKCGNKWPLVWWDTNSSPVPGFYTIQCQCDATTDGSCTACVNGSNPNSLCVDIPPIGTFFAQADASLPISSQYIVPGYNCADLT